MPDIDNVKADIFEVTIGGTAETFVASVDVGSLLTLHDVTTGRYGADKVKTLVQGRGATVRFEFQEITAAKLQRALGTANNLPPAVGAELPTHVVRLHPASFADASADLVFHALRFGSLSLPLDGAEEITLTVEAEALRDPTSGKVWEIGAAA